MEFPEGSPILTYTHSLRSRYSETDQMGYVYYGRYLEYFEVARTEMIRNVGLTYRELEERGIMLPVVHVSLNYKKPLRYDDPILIDVSVFDVPNVKLETFYKVYTDSDRSLHAIGQVNLAFMDKQTRRPCRAPDIFLKGLNS